MQKKNKNNLSNLNFAILRYFALQFCDNSLKPFAFDYEKIV